MTAKLMNKVNIFQIFPRFILEDVDGFAMCKALEAGLNYFLGKCQDGIDLVLDVDKMPEWRLDEKAWELNCLYDYEASIDLKREWVRNAYKNSKIHGTAEGVTQYLTSFFSDSEILEYFEYDGTPGEFRVIAEGEMTEENLRIIRKAVSKAKNVRSSLDIIVYSVDMETENMHWNTAVSAEDYNEGVTMLYPDREMHVSDIENMTVSDLENYLVNTLES